MDLHSLLRRNRRSLLAEPSSLTPSEKRAHDQFARDFGDNIHLIRAALPGSAK